MFVQDFEIHLIDGSVLPVSEPFEIEDDDSLIARFTDADQDEVFCVGDGIGGFALVPVRSIVYITTGDVRHVSDWGVHLANRMKEYGFCLDGNERRSVKHDEQV